MKFVKVKILLILLMLFHVQFSCKDKCNDLELYKEPYFSMQNIVFKYIDLYWVNPKSSKIMWDVVSQDYDHMIYPCDSLALYFQAPDTALLFHSENRIKNGFSLLQDAYACTPLQNGWAGTRDLVDKIFISSNFDFDETHNKDDNLSDIVAILAYKKNDSSSAADKWITLDDYNLNSPYEAPARFHLIIKRKPTRSMKQQFVVKYYMKTEEGEPSKYFTITTPIFTVR